MLPDSIDRNDVVILRKGSSTCTIHLFGATIISWTKENDDFIFLSSKAKFDGKSAIRGGIPIVFPCFGPWTNGPQHGFARISRWTLESDPKTDEEGNTVAVFSLTENEETLKMWDNRFKLTYTVTLTEDSLRTTFHVKNNNTDGRSFSFTCLLHSYFHVEHVTKALVTGLDGLEYVDKIDNGKINTEKRVSIPIDKLIDSVYRDTQDAHHIYGAPGGKVIQLYKSNLPDTVLWNPWEKAAQMADLDSYEHMVCVEAGRVNKPSELQPSGEFTCIQNLTIVQH